MESDRHVYVGVAVPGPDYPQRRTPVEVRVFATCDQADDWSSTYYNASRAGNAPVPEVYECEVERSRGAKDRERQ